MKQIFLFCLFLLAALGPVKAQKDGEQCVGVTYTPITLNPNPTNIPPSPDPTFTPDVSPPIEGYRGIYWVHGLGGDGDSWIQAAAATDGILTVDSFPARKTKSATLEKYSEVGLEISGNNLLDNIYARKSVLDPYIDDKSNNFIIAHSQGGFVAREAEKLLDTDPAAAERRQHFGIVTFGSPHQGAKIINSRNAGHVAEWLSDGCTYIIDAKVKDFLAHKPILAFFVKADPLTVQIENICSTFGNFGLPYALQGVFTKTSDSYAIGADDVSLLNAHNNPATKKVAFYGLEYNTSDNSDDEFVAKQAVWRLASSKVGDVSSADPFTADDDQDLVNKANQITMELYGQYQQNLVNAITAPCLFGALFCGGEAEKAAIAYKRAYDWFNSADYVWKFLIGQRSYGPDPSGIGYCEGLDTYTGQTACMANGGTNWYPNSTLMIKPSDGVVLAESAKTFPGAVVGDPMKGSNHFQMRNDSQLKIALNGLYDGANGIWFITEKQ